MALSDPTLSSALGSIALSPEQAPNIRGIKALANIFAVFMSTSLYSHSLTVFSKSLPSLNKALRKMRLIRYGEGLPSRERQTPRQIVQIPALPVPQ